MSRSSTARSRPTCLEGAPGKGVSHDVSLYCGLEAPEPEELWPLSAPVKLRLMDASARSFSVAMFFELRARAVPTRDRRSR